MQSMKGAPLSASAAGEPIRVMVVDDGGFNVGNAPTLDQAIQSGMKVCHDAGATNYRVYFSTCSPPVRIQ